MVFKKLFPKKGKNNYDEEKMKTIANLKALNRKYERNIKLLEKKALIAFLSAKKAKKAGNNALVKSHLLRYKNYQKKIVRYQNMILRNERYLDAVNEGDLLAQQTQVLELSERQLAKISETVNPERVAELTDRTDEKIDMFEEAMDILSSDPAIDYGEDISDLEAQLETEVMLEQSGDLPEVPVESELDKEISKLQADIKGLSGEGAITEGEEMEKDPETIKKEVEKLRKELGV